MNIIQFSTAFPTKAAIRSENEYYNRALSDVDGVGLPAGTTIPRELYRFFTENNLSPRHCLPVGGANLLNNVSGQLRLQKTYNMIAGAANLVQTNSANQPVFTDLSGVYDSVRAMELSDFSILQNVTQQTTYIVFRSTDPSGEIGNVEQILFFVSAKVPEFSLTTTRLRIRSRNVSSNLFSVAGRRQDADTTLPVVVADNNSNWNSIAAVAHYDAPTNGTLTGFLNGANLGSAVYQGSGSTSNQVSGNGVTGVTLGRQPNGTSGHRGNIAALINFRSLLTAEQIQGLDAIFKRWYPL